jgi:hypothetical protein
LIFISEFVFSQVSRSVVMISWSNKIMFGFLRSF